MKIKNLIQNKRGFTIIEFMMAMTMFVMVFLAALQSLGVFSFAKFYTTNRIELEQELHFFVEQLTSIIKV
jgi:prepilin-type N-terminal cleavage/methylation domain-containing protein